MAKSNYITRQGWLALDQELKFLWKEERPKVTQAVSDAAALGDRSENAEYIFMANVAYVKLIAECVFFPND